MLVRYSVAPSLGRVVDVVGAVGAACRVGGVVVQDTPTYTHPCFMATVCNVKGPEAPVALPIASTQSCFGVVIGSSWSPGARMGRISRLYQTSARADHRSGDGSDEGHDDALYDDDEYFEEPFIVTTRDFHADRDILEEIGVVSAGDVRSKNFFVDIFTAIGGILGGSSTYYTNLVNESTEAAVDALVTRAKEVGGTSVVGARFETATSMNRLIVGLHVTVLAYGTAVVCQPKEGAAQRSSSHKEKIMVADPDISFSEELRNRRIGDSTKSP